MTLSPDLFSCPKPTDWKYKSIWSFPNILIHNVSYSNSREQGWLLESWCPNNYKQRLAIIKHDHKCSMNSKTRLIKSPNIDHIWCISQLVDFYDSNLRLSLIIPVLSSNLQTSKGSWYIQTIWHAPWSVILKKPTENLGDHSLAYTEINYKNSLSI